MTFRVDPSAIRAYAKQLADIEQAATRANQYVSTYGDFDFHQTGLLGEVFRSHEKFVHAVKAMLDRISILADGSDIGLNQIATSYEHTDAASAAMIDATYPAVVRQTATFD